MKKPRKNHFRSGRVKRRRSISPAVRAGVRRGPVRAHGSVAPPEMNVIALGGVGVRAAVCVARASVVRVAQTTRIRENDDVCAFALLMAPFFIVALSIAANLSVQPGFRFERLMPELVVSVGVESPRDVLVPVRGSGDRLSGRQLGSVVRAAGDSKGFEVAAHSVVADLVVSGLAVGRQVSNVGSGEVVPESNGRMIDPASAGTWLGEIQRPARLTVASRFGFIGGRAFEGKMLAPAGGQAEGQVLAGISNGQALKEPGIGERGVLLGQRGEPVLTRSRYAAAAVASALLLDGDVRLGRREPGLCTVPVQNSVLSSAAMNAPKSSWALMPRSRKSLSAGDFGLALARAARAQVNEFVIYNDKYMEIGYPMGDVPALYGVCTDVVIRAYRELGVDLQELVYRSRIGRGDRSIGHRRVKTLGRFFERNATVLPITTFAEDYMPGDIVTYHRPQNRRSQFHIGIVSTEFAPSGRLKLIHNRGWGPQIEDALFVDVITGHYRYQGPGRAERVHVTVSAEPTHGKRFNP